MGLESTAAIAEILGAIAVVISLVYLSIQIRAQNKEARIASVHEILEAYRNQIMVLNNNEFAELYLKGISNFDSLNDAEALRFMSALQGLFRVWEEAYYQWINGRLDEHYWQGINRLSIDLLATDGGLRAWELRSYAYSKDFVLYLSNQQPGEYAIR